jgi:hypothetical protein
MTRTDNSPTTRATRGPTPVVTFGQLIEDEDHPGVIFVLPYNAGTVGGAQSSYGYAIPLALVTDDLTIEQVMAAALHVGEQFHIQQQMRAAVRQWAQGVDWRQHPHRCPREWTAWARGSPLNVTSDAQLDREFAWTSWRESCRDPEPADLRECRRRHGHGDEHASGFAEDRRRWGDFVGVA